MSTPSLQSHIHCDFETDGPDIVSIILINRGAETLPPFCVVAVQTNAAGHIFPRRLDTIIDMQPNVPFRFDFSRAVGGHIEVRFADAGLVNVSGALSDNILQFPSRH